MPALMADGHKVHGLDSALFAGSVLSQPGAAIPSRRIDIRDAAREDLQGFEALVHLAALSNDPLGDLDPDLTFDINYRAAVRLAALAKSSGVRRFIFASSCSNYGAGDGRWQDEESSLAPLTPYAESKVAAEIEIARLAGPDFSPTIMRNATVFGMSPAMRFDLVLNNLVAWACSTKKVYLKSDGTAWRPLVHVSDVARATVALLNAPREQVHNRIYNIGSDGENHRVRDLADMVASVVPGSAIDMASGACADVRCYRVSCARFAQDFPGHQPRHSAAEGVREVFAALDQFAIRPEEFEGPRFQRLAHLKSLLSSGEVDQSLRRTASC